MKLHRPIPVKDLAKRLSAELVGNTDLIITGINEVHHVEAGDLTFVDHPKYYHKALQSAADIILIDKRVDCPQGKALLILDDPFTAYNGLVWEARPFHPLTDQVSTSARMGENVTIEEGAIIGHHVHIGDRVHIQANVVIGDYCHIGDDVVIQPGSSIGSDAFYFKKTEAGYTKWRSGGRVIIGDRVDIGANCTINRGVSSDTVIGAGSKLDCQVQIGHDTKVGKNCLLAAQVGIAGNCRIGDEVVLYGQVGIAQNLQIGDKAVVLAKSGVNRDLEGGKSYFGYPAVEAKLAFKDIVNIKRLRD